MTAGVCLFPAGPGGKQTHAFQDRCRNVDSPAPRPATGCRWPCAGTLRGHASPRRCKDRGNAARSGSRDRCRRETGRIAATHVARHGPEQPAGDFSLERIAGQNDATTSAQENPAHRVFRTRNGDRVGRSRPDVRDEKDRHDSVEPVLRCLGERVPVCEHASSSAEDLAKELRPLPPGSPQSRRPRRAVRQLSRTRRRRSGVHVQPL